MKKGLLFVLLSSSLLVLNAQSNRVALTEIGFSNDVADALIKDGMLENLNTGSIEYLPKSALLSEQVAKQINSLNPVVAVERLYYISAQPSDRLELFNAMLKLSTLSGLQYKNSKNKNEPFITSASSLASPVSTLAKSDEVVTTRPRSFQTFLRQTDSMFGQINYVVDYMSQGDEVAMILTNIDEIKGQKIFTFAEKASFKTVIYYIPVADGYILYTASFNSKEGLGLGSKTNHYKMLSNRLEAYQNWFTTIYPVNVKVTE